MEWGDRDNKYYIPVMHIQITEDNKIPSTYEEIEKCEYIIDEYNPKKEKYRYSTIISDNITSRVQKLYKYIGNFPVTGLLEDEYIDNGIPLWLTWYNFGDNKIENYIKLGTNKNKKINIEEYEEIENYVYEIGIENGYMQDLGEHEEEYVPEFKNSLT